MKPERGRLILYVTVPYCGSSTSNPSLLPTRTSAPGNGWEIRFVLRGLSLSQVAEGSLKTEEFELKDCEGRRSVHECGMVNASACSYIKYALVWAAGYHHLLLHYSLHRCCILGSKQRRRRRWVGREGMYDTLHGERERERI